MDKIRHHRIQALIYTNMFLGKKNILPYIGKKVIKGGTLSSFKGKALQRPTSE